MKTKISASQVKRLVIGLVFLGLAIIVAMLIGGPLIFWSLFTWLVNKAVSNVGMNVWLARGLMVPVAALLFYAIGLTFSLKKKKRVTGVILLCVFLCLGSLAMYNFTKEQYFRPATNEPAQWYSKAPDGYRLYPNPGYDPIIGVKLQEVTPEVAREIEIWKKNQGKVLRPIREDYQFFDHWGRPIRWYYKDTKGKIEIFDQSGFHPTYGTELIPVNGNIVIEYMQQLEKVEKSKSWIDGKKQMSDYQKKVSDYREMQVNIMNSYLDYLEANSGTGVERTCFRWIEVLISELCGTDQSWKMSDATELQNVEILMRAWKDLYPWKLDNEWALETVTNIPIMLVSTEVKHKLLTSIEPKNGLKFIKAQFPLIEKNEENHYFWPYSYGVCLSRITYITKITYIGGASLAPITKEEDEFNKPDFQPAEGLWTFKGKIIIRKREFVTFYDGELVALEIVERLKHEPDSPEVKDLLSFIAQNSIWLKARERATETLAQQKQ